MKHFYIVANMDKENTKAIASSIEEYVREQGGFVRTSSGTTAPGCRYTSPADVPEETECVITLGGDGTFIQAARDLAGLTLPLIGINLGGLGYLTQMGREGDVRALLDALLEDRYEIQNRMMLKGSVYRDGKLAAEDIALNDIVVIREGELKVVKFRIYVDGQFLNELSADGVIVATPTGSTAYNLSAGGPIAQPDGELMILTPVCPHTLTSRTIVLGPESRIKIEISQKNRGSQKAAFDGDNKFALSSGDYIEIERAKTITKSVKLDDRSFLDILKHKMYEA